MNRIEEEILHGVKIVNKAEKIWGWATPAGQKRVERRVKMFIELGEIGKGKRILKIGCGTGVFTERIALTGAEIVAIDLSPDLLEKAQRKIKYPNVTFCRENIENMKFQNESFDTVIGSSILHHLNLRKAIKEISRVVKTHGKVVFTEPNMLNPQILVQKNIKFIGKLLGDTPSEDAFFKWQLRYMFQSAGFKSVVVEPFDLSLAT